MYCVESVKNVAKSWRVLVDCVYDAGVGESEDYKCYVCGNI